MIDKMTGKGKGSNLLKERFHSQVSEGFFLEEDNKSSLTDYLQNLGILSSHDRVLDIQKPGEGNMNLVLRVTTQNRSLIVKQSRPWVEKYPHISAPSQRAEIESLFYIMVQEDDMLQKAMPKLINNDRKSHILILEDLGVTSDFSDLYDGAKIQTHEIDLLIQFLTNLHIRFHTVSSSYSITNTDMRKLNHDHIFRIPFDTNNGIDLDSFSPGLRSVTNNLLKDGTLLTKAKEIGGVYMEDGDTLLHGDFYPGSWLRKDKRVYVIDHEFCFFGHKEFDIGVFIAHLVLTNQDKIQIARVLDIYKKQIEIDEALINSFVGIEMLRRLIGVAQLPLKLSLKEKKVFLEMARELVISHDNSNLPFY